MSIRRVSFLGLISVFLTSLALGGAISNWTAPATWSPPKASHGLTTLGDITGPLPFIGVTPCRQYDSRNVAPLADNTNLAVTLTGAPCGLPAGAQAVSVNITVLDITGAGGNGVFRMGTANDPTTAWINYPSSETQRANAGVVPVNGSGQIVVKVNQGGGSVDFTVDVNGYYASTPATSSDYFLVVNSGPYAVYGETSSTADFSTGVFGLASATSGESFGVWGATNGTKNHSRGVYGLANGTTGITYGVWGASQSTTSGASGVFGTDGAGVAGGNQGTFSSSGVEGQGQDGVIGRASAGNGVSGVTQTTAGLTTYGALGSGAHGVWAYVGDIGCSSCTKAFVDPHPTDPGKEIHFVSLEGNEAGTYFRGTAETVGKEFVIQVPEEFRMVTDPEGLTVQLTPVGAPATMYVVAEDLNQIVIRSSRDVKFHYLVQGIRPAYKDFKPIQEMSAYLPQSADGKMMQGWSEWTKRRLVANGTYNPDGTINMETAERVGWTKTWADREAQARAAAETNAAAHAAMMGERK